MGEKAPCARRQMAVHKAAHVSADQLRCERLEAHDAVDEIERDRACPDPDEDRGPAPPLPRIDDLMEHAKQQRAQSAAHEHVRGRPDVLDDRELQPQSTPSAIIAAPAPISHKVFWCGCRLGSFSSRPANTPSRQVPIAGSELSRPSGSQAPFHFRPGKYCASIQLARFASFAYDPTPIPDTGTKVI